MIDLKQAIGWYFLVLGLLALTGGVFNLSVQATTPFPQPSNALEIFLYPMRVAQWVLIYLGVNGSFSNYPIALFFIIIGYLTAIRGRMRGRLE